MAVNAVLCADVVACAVVSADVAITDLAHAEEADVIEVGLKSAA